MCVQYLDSEFDIDEQRWYFTKFYVEQYQHEVEWADVKATFDRTAEAVHTLLNAYRSAGVFGGAELTALKSTIQISETVGTETTQEQIFASAGPQSTLERASELVAEGTGIVGGTAFHAEVGDTTADEVFDILEAILQENSELAAVDAAAEQLLALDFQNVGGATLTPLLCLLRPARFPIVNQQSRSVFDTCFDIQLSNTAAGYLDSAETVRAVREEFGFDEHLRQLDYFCYWVREVHGPDTSILPDDLGSRTVWQIDVRWPTWDDSEDVWPAWKELGLCSMGWDIGPLDDLTPTEIAAEAAQFGGGDIESYLKKFATDIEPGQLIVAKNGTDLLGIGVTQRGGYHYCGNYLDEYFDGSTISHVHVWPVTWEVIPDSSVDCDTSGWGVTHSLLAPELLTYTDAFEGMRWYLANTNPALISDLATLEETVTNPPIASLPTECRSNTATDTKYFVLQTGSEHWDDQLGERYHFTMGIPGSRQLWEVGSAQVVFLEDSELYAKARITDIERQERAGDVDLYAHLEEYEELSSIDITEFTNRIDRSISLQHPIIEIGENDYRWVLEQGASPRYFWINSANDSWYQEGSEHFYPSTTKSGNAKKNQPVYKRARPGDKVVVYRNAPTQAIVGMARVKTGLHEKSVDGRDEPAEGITFEWEESVDGMTWDEVTSAPQFRGNPLVESGNDAVMYELSERQYKTLLSNTEVSDRSYYWVTASPAIWDLDSIDAGGEVFYTAYNEHGQKRRLFSAFESVQPGDRVVFYESSPIQQIVGEGTIVEQLHQEKPEGYDEAVEGITIRYDRPLDSVDWQTLISLPELEDEPVLRNNARGALFSLSKDAFEAIRSLDSDNGFDSHLIRERVAELRQRLSPPEMEIELPDGLYFESEEELRRQIEASLNSGKHIIFTGPPGTGKTKLAKHICEHVIDEHPDIVDGYTFTTATAEWTTFDTIGGYVPNRSTEGDELIFQSRLFLDCFRKDGAVRNEWLVIDEINRSNIDKAFGQLFSVLSGDAVVLPYERDSPIEIVPLDGPDAPENGSTETSSESPKPADSLAPIIADQDIFPVTPSWRLLATMNTFDKTSLYELSFAFMRRFNFIHVGVPRLAVDGVVRTSLLDPAEKENYATEWIQSNDAVREPLSKTYGQLAVIWAKVNNHQTIGPSIVYDMLTYLEATGPGSLDDPGPALTDAVIALVFPQLEGMPPQEQRRLVDSLTDSGVQTEAGIVDLTLDSDRLERKAEDFFDLPPRTDE